MSIKHRMLGLLDEAAKNGGAGGVDAVLEALKGKTFSVGDKASAKETLSDALELGDPDNEISIELQSKSLPQPFSVTLTAAGYTLAFPAAYTDELSAADLKKRVALLSELATALDAARKAAVKGGLFKAKE